MNIVFLCGALEPGRDGVGDYSRKLAGALVQEGHQVALAALNDSYITAATEGLQPTDGVELRVLRVPASWPAAQRFGRTKEWIGKIKPEWVSVQFVPYAFQAKGLPYGFTQDLRSLGGLFRWHIMFHELWLDAPERLTQHAVTWGQRFIISRLLTSIKPEAISVSIPFNQKRLKGLGIQSKVLPLFGNIMPGKEDALLSAEPPKPSSPSILYFGCAPRGTYFRQLLQGLVAYCRAVPDALSIIIVSGQSANKELFIQALQKELAAYRVDIVDCDFMESDALSDLMRRCTVGIARSAPYLIGKSGSAIAMLEHGLPVWLPKWRNNEPLEYDFRTQLIHPELKAAFHPRPRPEYASRLPEVATEFINQLREN